MRRFLVALVSLFLLQNVAGAQVISKRMPAPETDPIYSAWDKDYADLSNKPDLSIYAQLSGAIFTGAVTSSNFISNIAMTTGNYLVSGSPLSVPILGDISSGLIGTYSPNGTNKYWNSEVTYNHPFFGAMHGRILCVTSPVTQCTLALATSIDDYATTSGSWVKTGSTNPVGTYTASGDGVSGTATITAQTNTTQPYATTSTVLNQNLNADLLDGSHASQFLTDAPTDDKTYGRLNGGWAEVTTTETDPVYSAWIASNPTSGTNTGDQTLPTRDSLGLDTDDTVTFANLSGTNTGDQDLSGYALLTGATFSGSISASNLSGTNTGDQTLPNNGAFTATIDGGTSSPIAGTFAATYSKCGGVFTGWKIKEVSTTTGVSSSAVFTVYKNGVAISGTEKPTLSSQTENSDSSLTTWTTGFSKEDFIYVYTDSASTGTKFLITLFYTASN